MPIRLRPVRREGPAPPSDRRKKRPSGNAADEPQPMLDIGAKPTCMVPHMQALTDIQKEKICKAG